MPASCPLRQAFHAGKLHSAGKISCRQAFHIGKHSKPASSQNRQAPKNWQAKNRQAPKTGKHSFDRQGRIAHATHQTSLRWVFGTLCQNLMSTHAPLFFGKTCMPKNNLHYACSNDDVYTPSAILNLLRAISIYRPCFMLRAIIIYRPLAT